MPTQVETKKHQKKMAVELVAMYKSIKDDTMAIVKKAVREGWTYEKMIKEIEKLI